MLAFRSAVLLSMFVASTTMTHAAEFPTAPPKLKDAEAQGLYRMNTTELKAFMPGKVESKGTRGGYVKTFKADGSVDRADLVLGEGTGTWRFDEKNNAFCNAFKEKKGYQETVSPYSALRMEPIIFPMKSTPGFTRIPGVASQSSQPRGGLSRAGQEIIS